MSKEREALERICEIIRQENPAGAAHRIEGYMDAIKEMKDVAVEADDDTRRGAALMAVEHFTGHGREFAKDVSTVIYGIAYEAEEGLAVPEAEEGHMPTEEELRDIYRDKHTNISEHEEKQKILDLLLPAIQATRAGGRCKEPGNRQPPQERRHLFPDRSREVGKRGSRLRHRDDHRCLQSFDVREAACQTRRS